MRRALASSRRAALEAAGTRGVDFVIVIFSRAVSVAGAGAVEDWRIARIERQVPASL